MKISPVHFNKPYICPREFSLCRRALVEGLRASGARRASNAQKFPIQDDLNVQVRPSRQQVPELPIKRNERDESKNKKTRGRLTQDSKPKTRSTVRLRKMRGETLKQICLSLRQSTFDFGVVWGCGWG